MLPSLISLLIGELIMIYFILYLVITLINHKFLKVSEDVFAEFVELRTMEEATNSSLLDAAIEALKRDIAKRRARSK